ncbi:hypothetical protein JCM17795_07830 [Galenea microaerophila]
MNRLMKIVLKRLKLVVMVSLLGVISSVQAVTTTELDHRLQRLEKMAENPIYLKLMRRLETQEKEVQRLQDRMDRLVYQVDLLKKQADKRYTENDDRLSQLEAALKQIQSQLQSIKEERLPLGVEPKSDTPSADVSSVATPLPKPAEKAVKAAKAPLSPLSPSKEKPVQTHFPTDQEKQAYKAAFALIKEGKYQEATQALTTFVKQYPNSKLAANAAYWLGEVSLLQKQNAQALKAFDQVLNRYPNSLKVPDAMLRKADTLVLMGKMEEAKKLYQQVAKQYPNSRAAKSVQKRLKILADTIAEKAQEASSTQTQKAASNKGAAK